jgi:hypothetical protein
MANLVFYFLANYFILDSPTDSLMVRLKLYRGDAFIVIDLSRSLRLLPKGCSVGLDNLFCLRLELNIPLMMVLLCLAILI